MILTCDNCGAQYTVPDMAIGPAGRKVRCSACGHEWIERATALEPVVAAGPLDFAAMVDEADDALPAAIHPIAEEPVGMFVDAYKARDAKAVRRMRAGGYVAAAGVFVVLAFLVTALRAPIVDAWPPSARLFRTLGIATAAPGSALGFDRVTATQGQDLRGYGIVTIKGHIINFKDRGAVVPQLLATPSTAGGKMVPRIVPLGIRTMRGQQDLAFKTVYPVQGQAPTNLTLNFQLRR